MSQLSSLGAKALQIIASIAPTVGTAIGGPFGGLAGTILAKYIGPAVGKAEDEPVTPAEIEKAVLGNDPATLLALKNAENEFKLKMAEYGLTEDKLIYADAADARARDIEYVKAKQHNFRADFLAVAAVSAFIWVLYVLLNHGIPPDNKEIFVYLMGILTAMVKDLYGFEFGSSRGSQDKTQAMTASLQQSIENEPTK